MEQRVITILGGTGFLGRYVVQQLAQAGYRLRIICRTPNEASELYAAGHVGQIAIIGGNINKPESYSYALNGSYAVINLVGILFEGGKQKFSSIHSVGAEKLAAAAQAAGVKRFIHISALGVEHEHGSSYARSKILGERAVLSAFPSATILRPSVMFGAEDNFFNKFARMTNISLALPLIAGGKTLFQPVYVADVAKAIEVCLNKDESKGQIYELGGVRNYSFKQILEYILKLIGKKRFLVPIPFGLASFLGKIMELLPTPPLTCDQVKLLKYNNVVNHSAKNFSHLGITPTAVETIVPEYLAIYRKKVTA